MIIPHYCERCGQLTFRITTQDNNYETEAEFGERLWTKHPCAQIKPLSENSTSIPNAIQSESPIEFKHKKPRRQARIKPLSFGVILSCATTESGNLSLEAITPDNHLINIRVKGESSGDPVGKAIDLKSATRVGKLKYRINKLKEIKTPESLAELISDENTFFRVSLTSTELEQLENTVDRLLKKSGNRLSAPSIAHLKPIQLTDNLQVFQRDIYYAWSSEKIDSLNMVDFPEAVDVSCQQVDLE